MFAFALGSGACSSSTGPGVPQGVVTFTGTVPPDLPATCSDGDFFVVTGDFGSCTGTYYLLCDGTSWNDYSCTDPSGTSGWTSYSPTGDAGNEKSDTGASTEDSGSADTGSADSGSADAGSSTGDSGSADAGSEDAGSGSGSSDTDAGTADAGSGSGS